MAKMFVEQFLEAIREGRELTRAEMKEILDELWELDDDLFLDAGYGPYDEDDD